MPPRADQSSFPDGLGFLLGIAHRERRRSWEACIADLSLTAPQAAVLRLVTCNPGRGVRALARRLATDPMNVVRLVDSLVERQLIEVRPDPTDARRRPLYPTTTGQDLASVIITRAAHDEGQVASRLGPEAYSSLVDGLTELIRTHRPLDDGGPFPADDPPA